MRIRAFLQEQLEDGNVRCLTCQRHCVIIPQKYGHCKTRFNDQGTLYTTTYGLVTSLSNNPIEKKPLFHYYPGSVATTIGSKSCNFDCPWCQNWTLSKASSEELPASSEFMSPRQIVDFAKRSQVQGLSVSFNEPTLSLEYALELFELAAPEHLYCMFVTNGYMTAEALRLLVKAGLTGAAVTLKGPADMVKKYCHADVEGVWDTLTLAKSLGVHVEVISLLIPNTNDHRDYLNNLVAQVLTDLGPDTPIHFTRYFPAYKFTIPATPVKTLEFARDLALEIGLRYSYIGNVPGHPYENTYCPACKRLLIRRYATSLLAFDVNQQNTCPDCGEQIPLFHSEKDPVVVFSLE
ncbi:MAG: AmmeMemoRadiSam system radical SAM enzyme [Candidatus Heimdallarchaeota archaeon]